MNEFEILDIETKNYIDTNNVYIETGDDPKSWIQRKIPGEVTYGIPNSQANIKKVKANSTILNAGKLLYDCKYSFDSLGRRTTTNTPGDKSHVALFFGDSTAFGEGVDNEETLASKFSTLNTNYESFNYGFPGHGPSHMLLEVSSDRFKSQFKDKKGEVFFIFRDDAIKISIGKVPWLEGSPKYIIKDDKVLFVGEYNLNDFKEQNTYLPSEYTEFDFNLTLGIFKEIKQKLKEVSRDLNLSIIVIPLSFTVHKFVPMLRNSDIKCWNYYYTDLEFLTNTTARFVDGAHTPQANQVLIEKLSNDFKSNKHEDIIIPTGSIESVEDLKEELMIHSFMLPSMVDFPVDDAGVIIALLLKRYIGEQKLTRQELLQFSKQYHDIKINILQNNVIKKLIKKEYFSSKFNSST